MPRKIDPVTPPVQGITQQNRKLTEADVVKVINRGIDKNIKEDIKAGRVQVKVEDNKIILQGTVVSHITQGYVSEFLSRKFPDMDIDVRNLNRSAKYPSIYPSASKGFNDYANSVADDDDNARTGQLRLNEFID